jgi:2'-5' RNA ligase
MPPKELIFWIEPAEPLKQSLTALIKKLAVEYDGPEFVPHATVYANANSTEAEVCTIGKQITAQFKSIELIAEGLDHSALFTKTLFVQFRESAALRAIYNFIQKNVAQKSSYTLNPHLSLLYKKMPESTQIELCKTLRIPTGAYLFDTLHVLDMEMPADNAGSIRSLRKIASYKFKS